jgi:hypothetical protein
MTLRLPFISPVAGVSQYQEAVTRCVEGLRVLVTREPENPYDANACVVTYDGFTLGYVPKALAARLVESGDDAWGAELTEVLRGETWGLRMRVLLPLDLGAGAEEAVEAAVEPEEPKGPEVRSRSGRVLGTLVRVEGADAFVLSPSGHETPYPKDLVEYSA